MYIELTTATAAVSPAAPVGTEARAQAAGATSGAAAAPAAQPDAPAGGQAEAEQSLRALGDTLEQFRISLNFSRDEESGAIVVRLLDEGTGETIRQIPSEVALRLAAAFGKLQGLIFNRRA